MTEYEEIFSCIKKNWDSIAKPLDSLGHLEDLVARIGAVQGTVHPAAGKSAVIILCADNGVVEEGVSQVDQSVTRICSENIARGKTTVGIMAQESGTDIITVDVGINTSSELPGIINRKIRNGTRNFCREPAMTEQELNSALEVGKNLAKECREKGYEIVCVGEMGIGNTTTSSALAASMLGLKAEMVTGRGAGLSDDGLARKIKVVQAALDKYGFSPECEGFSSAEGLSCPYENNSEDFRRKFAMKALQTVGGFDIAAMTGIYLAARENHLPVVLDGAISLVAALAAEMIEKGTKNYLIPSHKSREPLVEKVTEALGLEPVLDASMALGEGTGAVLMMNIIHTAIAVYEKSVPFSFSGVEQYKRYK